MDKSECEECMFFKLHYAVPSGYEAICQGRTAKGRMIGWQYGLDMQWCKETLMESIRMHKIPSCCPWCGRKMKEAGYDQTD